MSAPTAPRVQCTGCGIVTQSRLALCPDCRPSTAKRPERPCKRGCGNITTAKDQTCYRCRVPVDTYTDEDGLDPEAGEWVTRGGIKVWKPFTGPVTPPRPLYRALVEERYAEPIWWNRKGELYDDAPARVDAHRAELMAVAG